MSNAGDGVRAGLDFRIRHTIWLDSSVDSAARSHELSAMIMGPRWDAMTPTNHRYCIKLLTTIMVIVEW